MKGVVASALVVVFAVLVNLFTFTSMLKSWGIGKETFAAYAGFKPQLMAEDIASLIRIAVKSPTNITLTYKFPIPENFTYDLVAENNLIKISCQGCKKEAGVEIIPIDIETTITNFKGLVITKNEEGVIIDRVQ